MGRAKRGKGKKKRGGNKKPSADRPVRAAGDDGLDEAETDVISGADGALASSDGPNPIPPRPTGCLILSFSDEDNLPVDARPPLPFVIGKRVEIPEGLPEGVCTTGTITGHWETVDADDEDGIAAYRVRSDCGWKIFVMFDAVACLRKSDEPTLTPVHRMGSRVECQAEAGGQWFSGTVTQIHHDWVELDVLQYHVEFDCGTGRLFHGPPDCIRESTNAISANHSTGLRFKVGDRVSCRCGPREDDLADGTVIQHWYKGGKVAFEDDYVVPYQIQLDSGELIWAPRDDDSCIMRSASPAPECWVCFDSEQTESNLITRPCACRGGSNGFVHTQCLVKLAQAKAEGRDPGSNDVDPFSQCITCRQTFDTESPCHLALAEACYETYKCRESVDFWQRFSTQRYAGALTDNYRYDDALNVLNEKISLFRSGIKRASKTEASSGSLIHWRGALAVFLLEKAKVYDQDDCSQKMKRALDESLSLIGRAQDYWSYGGCAGVAWRLMAKCAYNAGDKQGALALLEECAAAMSGDKNALVTCGNLNLECGNKERGLEQIAQGYHIIAQVYGRDCPEVLKGDRYMRKIEQGLLDKLPSHGIDVIF